MALIGGDAGNNNLVGGAGDDRILGRGGHDRLAGRSGRDRLEGGDGRDTLFGGGGDDLLLGGAGWDSLSGGDGRDVLVGGLGRDIMWGGRARDIFRFDDQHAGDVAAGPLSDMIRDFGANDVLDLLAADILIFDGFGIREPLRGGFSIWQAQGNTYVTWNTFNGFHDVELTGYTEDPFSQIRWYEDDFVGDTDTNGRIAAGQTRRGTIEVPEDSDWFEIALTAGQVYTFNLRGESSGAGTLLDPFVSLLDAGGNLLASDDNGSGTLDARLEFAANASGTYFVAATGLGFIGTYRLSVAARPHVDDFAGNITTDGRIAVGQTRTGEIEVANDEDWFRISLVAGETYTIDLRGQSSGAGTLPDPVIELLDKNGNLVASDDDGSGTLDARLVHTATAPDIYFIAAQEFASGTGTYELSVSAGAPEDSLL